VQFTLFSILACPPNFLWQSWLEGTFPGYTGSLPPKEKEKLVDDAVTGRTTGTDSNGRTMNRSGTSEKDLGAMTEKSITTSPREASKRLSVKNTAIKFSLDQTLGAAANTVLFLAGIALLRGQSWAFIQSQVSEQFWPMIFAGQKLWPAVSVLSFTVVPFEYRTLFGSIVGLFWGVYLSLVAGGKH